MKTRADYYSKVLGMSLTTAPLELTTQPESKETAQQSSPQENKLSFIFLALEEDIQNQKEMINKILQALGVGFNHVESDIEKATLADEIFLFGGINLNQELDKRLSGEFPSFSDVSKDQNLKKELWNSIKHLKVT